MIQVIMNTVHKNGGDTLPKILDNPKEEILKHAREIVLNEGSETLTMRKVSQLSGIAVGTLYNYFPTKRDLIIQLMENYWYDYLNAVDEIDKKEEDFYKKLLQIYKSLEMFVQTFLDVWVKNSSSEYSEDGIKRKMGFMEKLNERMETILMKEQDKGRVRLFLDPHTMAKFLLLNFYMMAQMKHFEYEHFEEIIKKLFQ